MIRAGVATALVAAFIASSPATSLAQNPPDGPTPADVFLNRVLTLSTAGCFERGDKLAELGAHAKKEGWQAVSEQELAKQKRSFARTIAGWLFSDDATSYAIIQSQVEGVANVYVCSVTTKLTLGDFDQFKSLFESQFSVKPDRELTTPTTATIRYSLQRADRTTVRTSLVSTPAQSMLTIRMIHGEALPPDI